MSSDRKALARAGDSRRPAFLRLTRPYARHRVACGLDGLWVHGLADARAALADRPIIFAANHVAWWDPLVLLVLDKALGGVCWAMVDSRSIRTMPFLGWLGALPLDRSNPDRARECLQSCAELLDRPGRAMWIFPQGRQRPAHLRPLDLKGGLSVLHDHNPVDMVVVSLDYVFLERDRPAALVRFSTPISGAVVGGPLLAAETALLDGLDVIDSAVRAATDGRRARSHPHDPFPGFSALVAPRGRAIQDGLGPRLLRAAGRGEPHVS